MNEAKEFISGVGYPIAVSCAVLYGVYKIVIKTIVPMFKILIDRFLGTLDTVTETNKVLVETNASVLDKVDKLDMKVDRILEEVSKHD